MKCGKCNADLEKGILVSQTALYSAPIRWATSANESVKGDMYEVKANRCKKCGNIEFNALEKY